MNDVTLQDVKYSHTLSFRISLYTLNTFVGNLLFKKYRQKRHMCRNRHSTLIFQTIP
jgi:hypothetical protein